MRTKIKLTKQQMKEDKFTTFMLKTKDWFIENWQIATMIVTAAVLIVAGVVYFTNMRANQEREAASRFAEAVVKYRQQNYQVAILDFNSIADEFSGPIAASAVFYAGNAYYESKNYDEAINNFQKYIDDYHQDDIMTASAIAGIAACMEVKQEFQPAAEKYMEAVHRFPDLPAVPDYLLGAVRNYVNAGMLEPAMQVLDQLNKEYNGTDQQRIATELTMKLRVE